MLVQFFDHTPKEDLMSKKTLVLFAAVLITLTTFAFAGDMPEPTAQPAQPQTTADAAEPTAAADATVTTETLPAACSAAAFGDLQAGASCGSATCGAGEYCCNPSCSRCVLFGMSCTQEACNPDI